MIINDSISVKKVGIKGKKQDKALLTFRDQNGRICHVYSSIPVEFKRRARVLSWDLESIDKRVAINQKLIERAKINPNQDILDIKNGQIVFKSNTIKVIDFDERIIYFPKIYLDSEYAYFKGGEQSLTDLNFKKWFEEYFIPRAVKLLPELKNKTQEEIFQWATKTIQKKKGHISHIGYLTLKDKKYRGYIGTTYDLETKLDTEIEDEAFDFEVISIDITNEEVELRFQEFKKALAARNAKKENVFKRFGVVSEDEGSQKDNIKQTLKTMKLRDWANSFYNDFYPFFVIAHYHGYDFESFKHVETKKTSQKSWQDNHKRRPRKTSLKEDKGEFFVKERFDDSIVLDPFYIAFNCLPQITKRNLENLCKCLGITFKKEIQRDYLDYYNLLVDLGDRESAEIITQYCINDISIMPFMIRKLYPQINSLVKIAEATGIPLKQLTLRRESLEELVDKSYYLRHNEHRPSEFIFRSKEKIKELNDRAKKMRSIKLTAKDKNFKKHLIYVAWPLFLENAITHRVPEAKDIFSLYRNSFSNSKEDPLTYIRYIEPIAARLLTEFIDLEDSNNSYEKDLSYLSIKRESDVFQNIHEKFKKDNKLYKSIIKKFGAAIINLINSLEAENNPNLEDILRGEAYSLFQRRYSLIYLHNPALLQANTELIEKYNKEIAECENELPEEIKQKVKSLNISNEDFFYLVLERQKLQRKARAFYYKVSITSNEFMGSLKSNYKALQEELLKKGFGIVKQRTDILEVVQLKENADPRELKEINGIIYLGAG